MLKKLLIFTLPLIGLFFVFLNQSEKTSFSTNEKVSLNEQNSEKILRKMPIYFEPNTGQFESAAQDSAVSKPSFFASGSGYEMAFYPDRAVMYFKKFGCEKSVRQGNCDPSEEKKSVSEITLKLSGANKNSTVEGENKSEGKINYLIGENPEKWQTDIPTYKKIKAREVYKGIDLVYYGNQNKLEFDFVVAPNADPKQIKLEFSGTKQISKSATGELLLTSNNGDAILEKPYLYQTDADGQRRQIDGSFDVSSHNQVAFSISDYDPNRELVIDPVLSYSTLLPGANAGYDVATDADGNAYVTGNTVGNLPVVGGANVGSIFVTKFNPQGSDLIFSTKIGGAYSTVSEVGKAIEVDSSGNIIVAGSTVSKDFPTVNPVKRRNTFYTSDNGADTWTNQNNMSERSVNLLAASFQNANTLYVAAADKVFKSVNGGTTWNNVTNNLPVNSSIKSLAVNPANDSQIYVSPAQNGLWRSNDGGATWSQIAGAVAPTFDVTEIGFAPSNPQTIYLGTGGGVRKSVDGGNFWISQNTGLPLGASITTLAVNPQNPQTVYVGTTTQGIYKTVDGGAGWTAVNSGIGGQNSNIIRKIAIAPSSSDIVYAVSGNYASPNLVFKTENGGGNWTNVYSGTGNSTFEITSIAVSRADSSKVYLGFLSGGLLRSVNGGASWNRASQGLWSNYVGAIVESPLTPNKLFLAGGEETNSNDAFVFKLNASGNTLLLSTTLGGNGQEEGNALAIDSQGNIFVGGWTKSLNFPVVNGFQSRLGNENAQYLFEDGFVAKIPPTGNTLTYSTYLGGAAYDNVKDLAVEANGTLNIVGETGSSDFPVRSSLQAFTGSTDAFLTKLEPSGNGISFSTFLGGNNFDGAAGVKVDSVGDVIVAGITDSNNFPTINARQSVTGGGMDGFVTKFSGERLIFSTYFGGSQPDYVRDIDVGTDGSIYLTGLTASNDFPEVRTLKSRKNYFRSSDNAETWSNFNTNAPSDIYDLAFHPTDPQIMLAVTTKNLIKTVDGGDTWTIMPNTPSAQRYTLIEFDPHNPNKLYLGYREETFQNNGKLTVSNDGGQTWTVNNQLVVNSSGIFRLHVSRTDPNLIYAATDFAAYKTTDGGNSWTRLTTLAITSIIDFRVHPTNSSILYIAQAHSDGGIHRSTDGGNTWQRMSDGITGFYGEFVEISPKEHSKLYARTGDGTFKTTDGGNTWTRMTVPQFGRRIYADPFNADILYMPGNPDQSPIAGFYRSSDDGQTWQFINKSFYNNAGCGLTEPDPRINGTLHSICGTGGTDAFVSKLNPTGTNIIFSTILGGDIPYNYGSSTYDIGYGVAAHPNGSVFVTGWTEAKDFPTTPGAYSRTATSAMTFFLTRFNPAWRVRGKITDLANGSLIPNVNLTLSGNSNLTTKTDGLGKYFYPNVEEGTSFTITPRKLGYDFNPPVQSVSNITEDKELNFTGTYITHTVRGKITVNQNPLPNVKVYLNGSQSGLTTTDSDGNYSFVVPRHGNYSVRPELYGYVFTPPQKTFSDLSADQTTDFQARAGYQISGRVLRNGAGFGGVQVKLSGTENQTVTTDSEGRYSFDASAGGNYTIKAVIEGFAFQPEIYSFSGLSRAETGDFNSVLFASRADVLTFVSEPSFSESQYEIFNVDTETGNLRRITQTSPSENHPAWSKNGRNLAYVLVESGNWLLSVSDFEGKNRRTLTNLLNASNPDWSPDGTKIVFSGYESNFGTEVYTIGINGDGLQRITTSPSDSNNPAWSPDGTKIVFVRSGAIHVMNPDGTQIQRLTNNIASENDPSWSPDGTKIVFSRGERVYLMNADGSDVRRLTSEDVSETTPFWSPDGTRIAYVRYYSDREIYVINSDGTNPKKITVTTPRRLLSGWKPRLKPANAADFDGDGKSDLAYFKPDEGLWNSRLSRNGSAMNVNFGLPSDKVASADFDGDAISDIAVFRPENGYWYILQSRTNQFAAIKFGTAGDIPAPADFDGDLKADVTVFRPENGSWYIRKSSDESYLSAQFGTSGDIPTAADYDGDARADLAVFRPSNGTWYIFQSVNGYFRGQQFGTAGDKPVPGDFDGDSKSDVAVFRPSDGTWYVLQSSTDSFYGMQFGADGDVPVSGDYDGDGRNDYAVFRAGIWYIRFSLTGNYTGISFGQPGDLPVNAALSAH